MSKLKLPFIALIFLMLNTWIVQGQGPWNKEYAENDEVTACEVIGKLPYEDLNKEEKAALKMMIEEEKLARDLYTTLGEVHDAHFFKNISEAENRHMEAIACLLGKYDLENPVENKDLGKFSDQKFQKMYESLVIRGKTDLTEALKIGAAIEDLDIYDLNNLIESRTTDNLDLNSVFKEMVRGSRNHMRAFTKNLKKQNASYEVQHISHEQYKTIISGEQERGGWLCGDEKPRETRKNGCKGDKGNGVKKCDDHKAGEKNCKGKGHHRNH